MQNIQTAQQAQAPANNANTEQKPLFPIHADGTGTFLAIAGRRIYEWTQNGQLDDQAISLLQNQACTAIHTMGSAFELLAMERIDYVQVDDNSPTVGALMTAGRAMMEFANIFGTLQTARRHNEREHRKQAGNPPDFAEQDGWPLV